MPLLDGERLSPDTFVTNQVILGERVVIDDMLCLYHFMIMALIKLIRKPHM